MSIDYVHGYSTREAKRLTDQANALRDLVHHDTLFPPGSTILEAGCGVGTISVIIAELNPDCQFVSIDISQESLDRAKALATSKNITNVTFQQADIFDLPFEAESFDHVLVCHVLEHLTDPVGALGLLSNVLKKGGTITTVEGDHGSCFIHPQTDEAMKAWQCHIRAQ